MKKFFYSRVSQSDADRDRDEAKKLARIKPLSVVSTEGNYASFVQDVWWPRRRERVKPTTKAFYDELISLHILPDLGAYQPRDIGYEEVAAAVARMTNKRTKGPMGPKRRKEAISIIKSSLRLYKKLTEAKGGERIRDDWELIEPPKVKRKKTRTEPSPELTTAVILKAKGTYMEGPVFCALFLGLRRGEICGLKWSHINRKKLVITISEQRHEKLAAGAETKSGVKRPLPITKELLARVDSLGDHESVFVFTRKDNGPIRPITPNSLTDDVTALCKDAGYPGVTLHDLRAYAASNLVAIGVDVVTVMELLGHTDIRTTQLYLYGKEETRREALKKLFATGEAST